MVADLAEHRGVGVAHHEDVLDGLHLRQHPRQQRHQRVVDDDDLVLGVVGDVHQLLGEEPDVERVQHGLHRRDGEVALEVLLVVPLERRDPVTVRDTESGQGVRQLTRALADLAERGAPRPVAEVRHHLAVTVHGEPVPEQHRQAEGDVLHGALHRAAPVRRLPRVRVRADPALLTLSQPAGAKAATFAAFRYVS